MLAVLKQYSTALLVGVAIVVAGLWVHDHTQQAVQRAILKQQVDSIAAKVTSDSIAAWQRDSAAKVILAQQAASEKAALIFAASAHTAMHAAIDSLQSAKSASDSIAIYRVALDKADTVIAQQQNAITAADGQIARLQAQVVDRDGQIASLRGENADLIAKLRKATRSSVWDGTVVKIVSKVLAAKGAYDVFRGR